MTDNPLLTGPVQTSDGREFLRDAEREGWLRNPSFDNFFLTDDGKMLRDLLTKEAKT